MKRTTRRGPNGIRMEFVAGDVPCRDEKCKIMALHPAHPPVREVSRGKEA